MAEFLYAESSSTQLDQTVRMASSKFGDGYEQVAPDGLNALEESWQVRFTAVSDAGADAIIAFFRAQLGLPFDWRPRGTTAPRKFTCRQWSRTLSAVWDESDISATFVLWRGPV
jgi:phage-related protein